MDPRLLEYYNRELSYLRETVLSSPPSIPKLPPDWGCREPILPTRMWNA
ncbi:type VI secretion protein [Salmonella enterica subsp. enterica]|uniref:Type VI secretion protein n=1 Tax=Salmonella enterica I TaxID=59201 RepID=A0A447MXK9_SALET|nr:type VI secretion protein [Salmonella enterica subsp. enterica]